MHIIIAGCGKVGELLTSYIAGEGHDVVVIDTDPEIIEDTVNEYDVMGIAGNCGMSSVLLEAGAAKADLIVAVTASDELNIICCMVAKKLGVRHAIARVRNPDYSKQMTFMRGEFGLSMAVNPEYDAAEEIQRIIQFPAAVRIDTFAKGRVDLAEVSIDEGQPFCGIRLSELSSSLGV